MEQIAEYITKSAINYTHAAAMKSLNGFDFYLDREEGSLETASISNNWRASMGCQSAAQTLRPGPAHILLVKYLNWLTSDQFQLLDILKKGPLESDVFIPPPSI